MIWIREVWYSFSAPLGPRIEPDLPEHDVHLQCPIAEHLGEATRRHHPPDVDLEESVLGQAVAQPEHHAFEVFAEDLRDPVAVSVHYYFVVLVGELPVGRLGH